MKTSPLFMTIFLLATFSSLSHATDLGKYQVDVSAESTGGWGDMVSYLDGWECSSTMNSTFFERLVDHKGEMKDIPQSIKTDYTFSFFSQPHVKMSINKDMSIESSLKVILSENCSKTTTHKEKKKTKDRDGNEVEKEEEVSTTENRHFVWSCQFKEFPTIVGANSVVNCKPDASSYGSFSLDSYLLSTFKQKKITGSIKLLDRRISYAADLCPNKKSNNRYVIKLSQGVDHLAFEDDFKFNVWITGQDQPVVIKNISGVLNDEILVCPEMKKGLFVVSVRAFEEDPVWDDEYTNLSTNSHIAFFGLSPSFTSMEKSLQVTRSGWWDSQFLDKVETIKVKLIKQP
ncbi:MAG: hypothetical protein ACOYL6_19150 [Bacteriovoracaceae bacterium]